MWSGCGYEADPFRAVSSGREMRVFMVADSEMVFDGFQALYEQVETGEEANTPGNTAVFMYMCMFMFTYMYVYMLM